MKIICQIYRSCKESGMYLYCRKEDGLTNVPEDLMARFGRAEPAMVLLLDENRKLANVDVAKVISALQETGYFLQLPPVSDMEQEALAIAARNSKLH